MERRRSSSVNMNRSITSPLTHSMKNLGRPSIRTVSPLSSSRALSTTSLGTLFYGNRIDQKTITDVKSNGLSTRLARYGRDVDGEEVIKPKVPPKPTFIPRNPFSPRSQKAQMKSLPMRSTSLRIAPPEKVSFHPNARSNILRSGSLMSIPTLLRRDPDEPLAPSGDIEEVPTPSVLDVLQEISRKRINSEELDAERIKKQCKEITEVDSPKYTGNSSSLMKRGREGSSPDELQKKQRTNRNNEISSSLSSTKLPSQPQSLKRQASDSPKGVEVTRKHPHLEKIEDIQQSRPIVIKETAVELARAQAEPIALIPVVVAKELPKLTLFNKKYTETKPIFIQKCEDSEEISFIKPKEDSKFKVNSLRNVEQNKLKVLLSCLSGELDGVDTIDAEPPKSIPIPMTPEVTPIKAPEITPVSSSPLITFTPVSTVSLSSINQVSEPSLVQISPAKVAVTTITTSLSAPISSPQAQKSLFTVTSTAPTLNVTTSVVEKKETANETPKAVPTLNFSFGTPAALTTSPAATMTPTVKPIISVIATSSTPILSTTSPLASTPSSLFSFGTTNTTEAQPKPATPGFSFGADSSPKPAIPIAAPSFQFGSSTKPADNVVSPVISAPKVTFGDVKKPELSFETNTTSNVTPTANLPAFGQNNTKVNFGGFGNQNTGLNVFGQSTTNKDSPLTSKPSNLFGTPNPTGTGTASKAQSTPPSSLNAFSPAAATTTAAITSVPSMVFGGSTTNATKPVVFGAPMGENKPAATNIFTSDNQSSKPSNMFGIPPTSDTKQAGGPSTIFGNTQAQLGGDGNKNIFGNATNQQKSPPQQMFGASSNFGGATQPEKPSSIFGASSTFGGAAPQQSKIMFGSGEKSAFTSPSQVQAHQETVKSTFGQAQETKSIFGQTTSNFGGQNSTAFSNNNAFGNNTTADKPSIFGSTANQMNQPNQQSSGGFSFKLHSQQNEEKSVFSRLGDKGQPAQQPSKDLFSFNSTAAQANPSAFQSPQSPLVQSQSLVQSPPPAFGQTNTNFNAAPAFGSSEQKPAAFNFGPPTTSPPMVQQQQQPYVFGGARTPLTPAISFNFTSNNNNNNNNNNAFAFGQNATPSPSQGFNFTAGSQQVAAQQQQQQQGSPMFSIGTGGANNVQGQGQRRPIRTTVRRR